MAKAALNFHPPPSLLLRVKSASEVDLKLHGVSPIVFLARCYGVEAGSLERNTLERLRAAVRGGLIGDDSRETISEAYRYLLGLRLRAQLRMLAGGKRASNVVRLSELSSVDRSRLKEAFGAIRDWQEKAAYHYRTDLF
jgi:CBS domain-containing protein